ncbi:MAG: iron ABC transporter permease, partial [Acidimicrobiia bacterium]|nr:iron ABC transporter permease [Acidimicrobiia bacterium]
MDEHRASLSTPGQRLVRAGAGRAAVRAAVIGVPLAFIGVFFLYPVASIIGRGLTPDGSFSFASFGDVFTDGDLLRIAWFTLWQAAVSTLITVALALPGAYVISRYRFRGRRLLRAVLTVPLILPTVVVGVAFLTLAGRDGVLGIDLEGSIWIILWAHAFYNYAVVLRTVGGLWANLDPRITDAARVLG